MAENIYSELACGELVEPSKGLSNLFCITAITMNIEQVKRFIKEVRWGFLATTDGRISCSASVPVRVYVRASPCFCLCQSVFMKYSAAISKTNRLTLSILTRLSCGGPDVIARPKAVAISYSLCSYALVLWSLPAFAERNGSQFVGCAPHTIFLIA